MTRKIGHDRTESKVFAPLLLPLLALLLGPTALLFISSFAEQFRGSGSSSVFDEESNLFFRAETHSNLVTSFSSFETLAGNPFNTPECERNLNITIAAIKVICEEVQYARAPQSEPKPRPEQGPPPKQSQPKLQPDPPPPSATPYDLGWWEACA